MSNSHTDSTISWERCSWNLLYSIPYTVAESSLCCLFLSGCIRCALEDSREVVTYLLYLFLLLLNYAFGVICTTACLYQALFCFVVCMSSWFRLSKILCKLLLFFRLHSFVSSRRPFSHHFSFFVYDAFVSTWIPPRTTPPFHLISLPKIMFM